MMHARSLFIAGIAFAACTSAFSKPPGPSLPPPKVLDPFPDALLTDADLDTLAPFNDTSYIVLASVGNTEVARANYTAEEYRTEAMQQVNDQTKIRVASITKLFTVLAVLLSEDKMKWDDSIAKFVPGLKEDGGDPPPATSYGYDSDPYRGMWDDVTIGSLAGHTSGLGYFGHVGDLSVIKQFKPEFDAALLGLPNPNNSIWIDEREIPSCDYYPGTRQCSEEEFVKMYNDEYQIPRSPNSGPLYSNIAFNLLGLALSKVHSKPYETVIKELIFDPLGMEDSSFDTPDESENALLPNLGDQWYSSPFGNFNPTGGIWTTPAELQVFLRSILDHKLLSPAKTRKWMQPRSFTNNVNQFVGAPWEIHRSGDFEFHKSLTYPRPIEIFTKAGGIEGYAGYAILVPEFDLTISINCAGNSSQMAAKTLMNIAINRLVPYYDGVARQQAAEAYAGNYTEDEGRWPAQMKASREYGDLPRASVRLEVDDGPGLVVKDLKVRNMPFSLPIWRILGINPKDQSIRLFPTDPESFIKKDCPKYPPGEEYKEDWRGHGNRCNLQYWRMSITSTKDTGLEEGSWMQQVPVWMDLDRFRYAGKPLDTWVFRMDEEGKVFFLELPGWRVDMCRYGESCKRQMVYRGYDDQD